MSEWYLLEPGHVDGPFTTRELLRRRQAGLLADDAWIRRDQATEWVPVTVLSEEPEAAPLADLPPLAELAPLAYAPPKEAEAAQTVSALTVRSDDGPFLQIGSEFSAQGRRWGGPVVATPTAVYFLKDAARLSDWVVVACTAIPGLATQYIALKLPRDDDHFWIWVLVMVSVMALLMLGAQLLMKHLLTRLKPEYLRTCSAAQLPPAVLARLDPDGTRAAKDAVVVPKALVRMIVVPAFGDAVQVSCKPLRLAITNTKIGNAAVGQFLDAHGYPVRFRRGARVRASVPFVLCLILIVVLSVLAYQWWLQNGRRP